MKLSRLVEQTREAALQIDPGYPKDVVVDPAFEKQAALISESLIGRRPLGLIRCVLYGCIGLVFMALGPFQGMTGFLLNRWRGVQVEPGSIIAWLFGGYFIALGLLIAAHAIVLGRKKGAESDGVPAIGTDAEPTAAADAARKAGTRL